MTTCTACHPLDLEFTGEYHVPGKSPRRVEQDHMARYEFAARYARQVRVLDAGCGTGYGAPVLLGTGALSYLGIDSNPSLIKHAQRTYGNAPAHFCVSDISRCVPHGMFDLIVCFEVIEHVRDHMAALVNLRRMLAQNGMLLISSPNRRVTSPRAKGICDPPQNPFHLQEFIPEELKRDLRSAGYRVSCGVYGQRLRPGWLCGRVRSRALRIAGYDLDEKTSPEVVVPPRDWVPRYFMLTAWQGSW